MNSNKFIILSIFKTIYLSFLRRKKIISYFALDFVCLEFLFRSIIESFLIDQNTYRIFTFSWIIFSYFLGRYYYKIRNYKFIAIKALIISLFIFVLTLIFSISLLKLFNSQSILFGFNKLDINILLLYSFFSNLFILIINTRKISKKKTLLVFNDQKNIFSNINFPVNSIKNLKFIQVNSLKEIFKFNSLADGLIVFNIQGLDNELLNNLLELQKNGLIIFEPYQWCKENLLRYPAELIVNSDLYFSINRQNNLVYSRIKRVLDIFFSLILLFLSLPIILISCFIIFFEENGPIFYSQIRTGFMGKPFKIWKIRSMRLDSEPNGAVWSSQNDSRVLRFGRFLRRSRIDELPQLISVIIGDMSLIGPRPERPELEVDLIKKLPNYMYRYKVKPGLSGWAQINYPYGASFQDSKNKLSYDFFYIFDYSFGLDLIIFFKTIRIIFGGSGSKPVN